MSEASIARPGPIEVGANNFDFLRFSLAVLVILSHSFALTRGSDATEPLFRLSRGQITSGELGVDGFFIISGFLITHSWMRGRGILDFLRKRVARIYPGYLAVLLFAILVVIPLATRPRLAPFAPEILRALRWSPLNLRGLEMPGTFPDNPIHAVNGSLWSVSYEAWCYIGVLMLGLVGGLRRRGVTLAVFLAALALSLAFLFLNLNPGGKILHLIFGWPRLWARMLPYFLSGMVFYLYRERIRYTPRGVVAAALALGVAVFVPHGIALAMPLAGAYLLLAFAFSPAIRLQGWAKPGDFSYGIYLYAFPLQQLLIHLFGIRSALLLFVTATPLSILFGAASWHALEKWFLNRRRRSLANDGALLGVIAPETTSS